MSILSDKFPLAPRYTFNDTFLGGRFNNGKGLTFTQGLATDGEGNPVYPFVGAWNAITYMKDTLLVGNGTNFQPAGSDRLSAYIFSLSYEPTGNWSLVTNPIILGTLAKVKQLVSFNIAYEGTLAASPFLTVYTRKNFNSPDVVTYPNDSVLADGYLQYFLRDVPEHKIIRFKLSLQYNKYQYISKILGVSLTVKAIETDRIR